MLFLKIFDDKEVEYELDPAYVSPIPARLRWRAWAAEVVYLLWLKLKAGLFCW
jgi:hypothetical protein